MLERTKEDRGGTKHGRRTRRQDDGGRRPVCGGDPQVAWNSIRPKPVVLVSGTEGFLADRAIRMLRDQLKAEDPSLGDQ